MVLELRLLLCVLAVGFWLGVATTLVTLSLAAARANGGDIGEASIGFILALAALVAAGYFLYLALNL